MSVHYIIESMGETQIPIDTNLRASVIRYTLECYESELSTGPTDQYEMYVTVPSYAPLDIGDYLDATDAYARVALADAAAHWAPLPTKLFRDYVRIARNVREDVTTT